MFLRILGGEPFFRKDLIKVMYHAAKLGMIISFSTNASLINDNCARMLKEIENSFNYFQVSLYGVDTESYKETTKSSKGFQLVVDGIKCLKKYDLNPYVFWVLTKENIRHVESAYKLVSDWGLPALRISPKLSLGRASGEQCLGPRDNISFWRNAIDMFSKLNALTKKSGSPKVQLHARPLLGEFLHQRTGLPYFFITCKAASTMVYVDFKGEVSPCPFAGFMPPEYRSPFDFQEKISLLNHTLDEIWQSEVFKSYRRLQDPKENPNKVNIKCPHLLSGLCNPCIYTPCTCSDTIKFIKNSK